MPTTLRNTDILFNDSSTQSVGTSGNFKFNSGYGSEAVAYGCRAWVNFNGTGTISIYSSGNISSITDNGIGDYTLNFTTALADVNYSYVFGTNSNATSVAAYYGAFCFSNDTKTTSAFRFHVAYVDPTSAGAFDTTQINVAIFR